MKKWQIFIPTYNRPTIAALKMLTYEKNKDLRLTLVLRPSEYDSAVAKYKDSRLSFLKLDDKTSNIGDTRRQIVEHAEQIGLDYCVMIDDGIEDIYDTSNKDAGLVRLIDKMISDKEASEYSDYLAIIGVLRNDRLLHRYRSIGEKYLTRAPYQFVCIDLDKIKKQGINYKSSDIVGLEDAAFFVDCLKSGLACFNDLDIVMDGAKSDSKKVGGNHLEDEDIAEEYRLKHLKLLKYIGPMYGVSLQKEYRQRIGQSVEFVKYDLDMFRDCILYERSFNKDILKSRFKLPQEEVRSWIE